MIGYSEKRTAKAHAEPGNQRQPFEVFEEFALIPEDSHVSSGGAL